LQDETSASGHRFESQDVLVPWHVKGHVLDPTKRGPEHATFDDEKQSVVFQRYCHVYREGELQELVESLPNAAKWLRVERVFYDTGNWCMIVEKVAEIEA
jgi:alkylated DNA repair protein alkB family protein 8